MTILSLATWRRRRHSNHPSSPNHTKATTANNTTTTTALLSIPTLSTSDDTDRTTQQIMTEDHCIHIPRRPVGSTIVTPDGLKARNIQTVRNELQLTQMAVANSDNNNNHHSTTSTTGSSSSSLVVASSMHASTVDPSIWKTTAAAATTGVLPALPQLPSRSWSTIVRNSTWSFAPTPTSSQLTNSFTAQSPNLNPGFARTAVGNLVGQPLTTTSTTDSSNHHHNQLTSLCHQDPPGTTPTTKLRHDMNNDYSHLYSPQEDTVERMYSPMLSSRKSNNNSIIFSPMHSETRSLPPPLSSGNTDNESILSSLTSPLVASNRPTTTTTHSVVVHTALDTDLRRLKARNELKAKEELLLEILERLQDDPNLLSEIDAALNYQPDTNNWTAPGLLAGYEEAVRNSIIEKLDLLISELNADIGTDEFVWSSPDKLSEYQDTRTHQNLLESLVFTKALLQMAIPQVEKEESSLQGTADVGQWKFVQLQTIGLLPPESPQQQEQHNVSTFSLPSQETPMTSNKSLGNSTLTTRPHTIANENDECHIVVHDGLQLRQALWTVGRLWSQLSETCWQLYLLQPLSAPALIQIAHTIKSTYLELMRLNSFELKGMVDSFEFVIESMSELRDDDDEDSVLHIPSPPAAASAASAASQGNHSLEWEQEDDDRHDTSSERSTHDDDKVRQPPVLAVRPSNIVSSPLLRKDKPTPLVNNHNNNKRGNSSTKKRRLFRRGFLKTRLDV